MSGLRCHRRGRATSFWTRTNADVNSLSTRSSIHSKFRSSSLEKRRRHKTYAFTLSPENEHIVMETTIVRKDVFLTSDERYDIWEVKRLERPQLLTWVDPNEDQDKDNDDDDNNSNSDNDTSDDESLPPLPLIDGCDLPGWRASQLVPLSDSLSSILNVGPGCPMLRRESQLPIVPSSCLTSWRQLYEKFIQEPSSSNTAIRISSQEARQLTHYPWFERQNIPVVLEGLTDDWPAMKTCRWTNLVEKYGDYVWRCSDTHGAGITLKTYQKYISTLEGQTDDAPLAIYDSQLSGDDRMTLLEDYTIATCFASPDLFENLEEEERPPYRWILMGPARSGTGLHIDPMGTHAWVTVVEGLKRWVLFPHGTDRTKIMMPDIQIPSAIWFDRWYDSAVNAIPGTIEVLQYPGETVYVPAGWPHLVLNLECTVAITHNYATEYPSMDRIIQAVQEEEPDLYMKWIQQLNTSRPDLIDQRVMTQHWSDGRPVTIDPLLEGSDTRI